MNDSNNEVLNKTFNREVPAEYDLQAWDNTTTPNVVYYGYAAQRTSDSAPDWVIKEVNTSTKRIKRATGAWDDRASLRYR